MEWPPRDNEPAEKPGKRPYRFPPEGWPSKAQVDYTTALIFLGLLLLALPWIMGKLLTDPEGVIGQGRRIVLRNSPL